METRERRRRRPRPRTAEGGRRLHSAGSAIVVSLAGLAIALFLNAPGLHKSATIQPEGWKRDVALAVTGPLQSVSGALLLDRPRQALKSALGRSDDDEIDTAVAAPQPKPTTPVTTPGTLKPVWTEYVSIIHAMVCSFVPMSGAGMSICGPMKGMISCV